jgi:hypothetical protein
MTKSKGSRPAQILGRDDGTWKVAEDEHHGVFPNHSAAMDSAREIAGKPDLPPLTHIK